MPTPTSFDDRRVWTRRIMFDYDVIPRSEATHPRVASLAPSGQFTFWESPGTAYKSAAFYQEIATA